MSLAAGQLALMKRVATMPDAPNVVWPNGEPADLPRLVMQPSGGGQSVATISGVTDATPEIVVRVETESGQFTGASDALVAALMDRFKPGDRFDGVRIIAAPQPRAPIEGTPYVVPVVIRGRQFF
ncbi:hypothetical protein [Tranquillimonas rosea]|uniref:hypothetical protein n=1 Tax=Tranquillimonas rosea TaxID=641238 RepID=UPI003BA9FA60